MTYLSNGSLKSYETIVNGTPLDNPEIESILGHEWWWKELQQRRMKSAVPRNVTDITTLFGDLTGSFHRGKAADRMSHLNKFIKTRKRHTISGLNRLGVPFSMTMRTQRLRAEVFSSDSEPSDSESDSDESSDGALSEGDLADFQEEAEEAQRVQRVRRASTGDALGQVLKHNTHRHTPAVPTPHVQTPVKTSGPPSREGKSTAPAGITGVSRNLTVERVRPAFIHRVSSPSFTSRAIPDTKISTDDDAPSIGFSSMETATIAGPSRSGGPSSLKEPAETTEQKNQSGAHIPVAISFNDLPGKAQHFILNELIRKYSDDTAVIFTTLPSPATGTHKSEKDSVEYLSALEVSYEFDLVVRQIYYNRW